MFGCEQETTCRKSNLLNHKIRIQRIFAFSKSTLERKQARQKCMENRLRLGQFVTQRQGATFVENWTDGTAFTDIAKQQELIQRAREDLDRERRNLLRRRPNCDVKEKPPKTPNSKSRTKDRTGAFVVQDESSNDGMKNSDNNKAYKRKRKITKTILRCLVLECR